MSSVLSRAIASELENREVLKATFNISGQQIKVCSLPLTAADFEAVNKRLPVSFQSDPTQFSGQIDMLIRKVRIADEEGEMTDEKALTVADRPYLMRLGVDVISHMFVSLYRDQVSTDDEADDAPGN